MHFQCCGSVEAFLAVDNHACAAGAEVRMVVSAEEKVEGAIVFEATPKKPPMCDLLVCKFVILYACELGVSLCSHSLKRLSPLLLQGDLCCRLGLDE